MAPSTPGSPESPTMASDAGSADATNADPDSKQAECTIGFSSAVAGTCSTSASVGSSELADVSHGSEAQLATEGAACTQGHGAAQCQAQVQCDKAGASAAQDSATDKILSGIEAAKPSERETHPGNAEGASAAHRVQREITGAAKSSACIHLGEGGEEEISRQGEALDVASLFLSPSEDLDSWSADGSDLLLPASSFVSADAISQHTGPMSLGRVALFIFGLFQGDVRMGLLSAQGRLLAWRCLLYLAEQHDRQGSGGQPQLHSQVSGSHQAPGASAGDPVMRRRRMQRESVATSKGRRSVRHAFLLDRNGATRGTAAGPPGSGSGFSPGANDEWGEAEEEAAGAVALREDTPGETAGEQALVTSGMSAAMTLQRQLQQGPQTIGFESHFPRFIGGTVDRRWALQCRSLRIPVDASKADAATGKEEPLEMRLEEFGASAAQKMWPRVETLPERLFVGLPIQVACWVSWGRTDGGEAGRMLWRDCEVAQILFGGSFRARCFAGTGEPRQLTCHLRDFVPPRVPIPSPHECAWRLVPLEADAARDIYPGACLSVGLSVSGLAQQQQDQQQQELARAYFVDVVVQDIYFSLEQTTRARQALAEARERDEANGGRSATTSRRTPGLPDTGGPVEGLRPNCAVKAMRVMVLRSGGAANEFALISGRTIYKLGYDLYTHAGIVKESPSRQRQGGARLAWAVPRSLIPAAPEQGRGAAGAALGGGNAEANAKRWQYRTQEDSRDWLSFPPFIVAYFPYDCRSRYTETYPLLVRYLQPELDLAALARGVWRLCLPQYEHPKIPPVVLPHPSDLPKNPTEDTIFASGSSAEGIVVLESPYSRNSGGQGAAPEGRSTHASDDITSSLYAPQPCEPPQPVSAQSSAEAGSRTSVLGINHLASLLCSGGDSSPPKELLSKSLPFFRGLLPHIGSQGVDSWQAEVSRAAVRAADQARELYVEEPETEAEKLRRQGISFGAHVGGSSAAEAGRSQRGAERAGGGPDAENGEAWEWVGSSGSRYPTSSDISRFLLRTSGHSIGGGSVRVRGVEASSPQGEAPLTACSGGGRRRPVDAVGDSRRGSTSEMGPHEGRSRADDPSVLSRGVGGGDVEYHGARRLAASASSRTAPEEALNGSRARAGVSAAALAAGAFGVSSAVARRRPVVQREEEEDFQPPARAATGARQPGAGGRAGMARRAARNVSYTALAGMEPGPEDPALYRPLKRVARGDPHASSIDASTTDRWDHHQVKDVGGDAAASGRGDSSGERHVRGSLQQWAALQRQAAAEERLLSSQGARGLAESRAEASISTDQLHEALKGFVQSIKAGTSPAIVSVPPMARNRSFAASH